MGPLFAEVWLLGLLSGLDPLAFVAVVVVSAQQRRNGVFFCAGWLLTLTVLTFAPALFLHGHPAHETRTSHRHLIAWLLLVIGIVLIALAINTWRLGRRGATDEVPRWYRRLRRVGPKTSFLTGLVLPSFPAAIAAGTAVFHSNVGFIGQLVVIAVFLAVSSWNVITPTVLLYARPSAAPALARLNDWAFLRRHRITFVVLAAIGVFLVVRSVIRLTHGA